jgi:hypothetical protein
MDAPDIRRNKDDLLVLATTLQTRHSGAGRTSAKRAERPKDGPKRASAASNPVAATSTQLPSVQSLDPGLRRDDGEESQALSQAPPTFGCEQSKQKH